MYIYIHTHTHTHIYQFRSVAQSCPTLCYPMNRSTPGLPVHHQLPEFTQTHVHRVGDAIQPPHPLSSPSPPAPNPSQHQGLFQWVNSSHEVAKVLEFQLQHQPFQWTPRTGLLQNGLIGSPCSPSDSQESSPTPQFKSINSSPLNIYGSKFPDQGWNQVPCIERWILSHWTSRKVPVLFSALHRVTSLMLLVSITSNISVSHRIFFFFLAVNIFNFHRTTWLLKKKESTGNLSLLNIKV